MLADIAEDHQRGKNKTAVKNQSALVDAEDFPEIATKLIEELEDISDPCAGNAADHDNNAQVDHLIGSHACVIAFVLKDHERSEEPQSHHDPIPVDAESEQLKCDPVHNFIFPSIFFAVE